MNNKGASKLNPIGAQPRFHVLGLIGKDSLCVARDGIAARYANRSFLPIASPPSTRNDLNRPVNRIGLDRYP